MRKSLTKDEVHQFIGDLKIALDALHRALTEYTQKQKDENVRASIKRKLLK